MESFTIELVSNATAQLFPEKTLSSFTNFLQEQLNLEGQWGLQFQKNLNHQCRTISERETSCFQMENVESRLNLTIWNPFSTLLLQILFRPWTFSLKKYIITAKAVSQLKCLEERKKLRFPVQLKGLVLHSLVQTWDTISVAMLAMNLEQCWPGRDLTNQKLLTTLSAYTLSWYTRTCLSTISLPTRSPIAELLSFHFKA